MIPIHWSSSVKIPNAEQLVDQVQNQGGSIVEYQRVFSFLLFSQSSPQYVWVRPGGSRFTAGLEHTIISLILGWWSLPGIIWTPATVLYNSLGGTDVTRLLQLMPRSTPPPLTARGGVVTQPPPLNASESDEIELLRILESRDRFRSYKLWCGVALCVLIFCLGYWWSEQTSPKRDPNEGQIQQQTNK